MIPYVDAVDDAAVKSEKCLQALVECSKRDLQLRRSWLGRVFLP